MKQSHPRTIVLLSVFVAAGMQAQTKTVERPCTAVIKSELLKVFEK